MAVAIPEAVEAVSSGTAAVERAGSRKVIRAERVSSGRGRATYETYNTRAGRRPGAPGETRSRGPRVQPTVQLNRRRGGARRAGTGALRARLPGSHSYQPVILAEFIAAVVIVATGPVVKGGTPEAQTKGSPSPYSVNTIKQLLAIGGVYFVLALLAASQRAGRLAAWFGGLVLIGLGLTELANGDLSAIFHVLGPNAPGNPNASPGQLAQLGPGFLPTASGGPPTPTGQVPQDQAITQQSITFIQPGVATTTEQTPGVTLAGS